MVGDFDERYLLGELGEGGCGGVETVEKRRRGEAIQGQVGGDRGVENLIELGRSRRDTSGGTNMETDGISER